MSCDAFKSIISEFFEYDTTKIVHIKSKKAGILNRIVQLIIIAYIVCFAVIYKKGYQDFSTLESSVTTKVKGVAYTNFSNDKFNPKIKNFDDYRRVWDVSDYVIPSSENGAFFVTTNVVVTPNQTQFHCPEDPSVPGALCDPKNNTCVAGTPLLLGNGVMTGNCVASLVNSTAYVCEINAWCPVEQDINPLKNNTALLAATKNFTVLIKNFVEFPKFNIRRSNILDTTNTTYLSGCHYHSNTDPACPIFVLGDIIAEAGENYDIMAVKGGVIAIIIEWDCNIDFDIRYCIPIYSFRRLDDPEAKIAKGWNFRYSNYYDDNSRTLYKVYGIKYDVIVHGRAGKFNVVPLMINIGSGLGLLAVASVIGDIIVLYLLKKRDYYRSKKYLQVTTEGDAFDPEAFMPSVRRRKPESSTYSDLDSVQDN
ncbi:P2X purinoceptor 4-like [Limulus polyphemus]|uniref:P2X purinoceptor 4-like n=1 Tax=Limulus polyphemus TaxID=6850 RepID=A0ABM1BDE5_LIMPO|nr:P2X purinoceptor 4-like [Limulus polyphemus]